MTAKEILNQYWGYPGFRGQQESIIQNILNNKDVLALLPTGAGKSICYQVPGLMLEGTCLVISPLLALIDDQVQSLKSKGISAISLSGIQRFQDLERITGNVLAKPPKFLFISPEKWKNEWVSARLSQIKVSLLAIDEAHCISKWGHEFRPAYLDIGEIREALGAPTTIALTATATQDVQNDIVQLSGLYAPEIIQGDFLRANLKMMIIKGSQKTQLTREWLKRVKGSCITYIPNRAKTEKWAKALSKSGVHSLPFHAGLSGQVKTKTTQAWLKNEVKNMVATSAFGMGIDKPDVRLVLHPELPDSLESYFQEAGRAGRDGKDAYNILLLDEKNDFLLTESSADKFPDLKTISHYYNTLQSWHQIAIGSGEFQSIEIDIPQWVDRYNLDAKKAFYVLRALEKSGVCTLNENGRLNSHFQFKVSNRTLYDIQLRNVALEPIIQLLLRAYPGILVDPTRIKEEEIAKHINLPLTKVESLLQKLADMNLANYLPKTNKILLQWLINRQEDSFFNPQNFEVYLHLKEAEDKRVLAFKDWINTHECRQQKMATYFGAKVEPCGVCDNCMRQDVSIENPHEVILENLKDREMSWVTLQFSHKAFLLYPELLEEALVELVQQEKVSFNGEQYVLT